MRRWLKYTVIGAALLTLSAWLAAAAFVRIPLDPAPYLDAPRSGTMLDREGRVMYAFLDEEEQWAFPRPLSEISPRLIEATIAVEDQRFHRHSGVDLAAVLRAASQNVRHGRTVSGASTITMQVVKRVDGRAYSVWGKARQALQAMRLERRATKRQILEAYLNTAPYGMNLVGCEAAAQRYFGKPARELTLAEAALLAGLPKAPTALLPLRNTGAAEARRAQVLQRMHADGYVTDGQLARTLAEPLGVRWHDFPGLSPHLAMRLRGQAEAGPVHTTLDASLQRMVERMLKLALGRFEGGITNGAVLVADVPSATVLARAGSADFFDTPGGGQVDVLQAPRSPGSALKPFIYALAMEQDLLYASEMFLDDALDYGLYNPANFDGRYRGLVSATDALRDSLNVPAVTVLERVGVRRVYDLLESMGLTTLHRTPGSYGLGLTLGDCEVRLEELAGAYCALASVGQYRPLRVLDGQPQPAGRLLRRDVALALYAMMEQPFPHEFDRTTLPAADLRPRVCWKTGTSNGYRDAWAFVYNAQYLVGVWMGNNSGAPSSQLVGAHAALPLAASIFRSLPDRNTPAWPDPGDALVSVRVCAATGLPVSPWCRASREAEFPKSQFLNRRCGVHFPAAGGTVRPAHDASVGGGPGAGGHPVAERWPGQARGWDLANVRMPRGLDLAAPPGPERRALLRIVTPANNAEFVLTGEPQGDQVRLRTSYNARRTTLHWYLNERYLGKSGPDEPMAITLTAGAHTLTCLDPETGATDSVQFKAAPPEGAPRFIQTSRRRLD